MLMSPSLTGPVVVKTQRKPLGGKINVSLIKLEMFVWVYKRGRAARASQQRVKERGACLIS